jgi:TolB-like protein/TolA-binding protein
LALGAIVGAGHILGGVVGWWHAYELTVGAPKSPRASAASGSIDKPSGLSIVVLPLVDKGDVAGGDWFADVLSADLTTRLGTLSGALVISRETAFTYKGKVADPRQVARELGVRYVVHGEVRRHAEQVQLRLALVDGDSGAQRWAYQAGIERSALERSIDDIAVRLARELGMQLYRSAGERAAALDPAALRADDVAMQGWAVYLRGLTRDNFRDALVLFERAAAMDAKSVRAWGGVSVVNATGAGLGWLPDREAATRRVEQASERLQALDDNDWFTWTSKASLANLRRDYESSLLIADAMIERFPSNPSPHFNRGLALLNLGRFEACDQPTLRALRIGPRDTQAGLWRWQLATCHFMREQYPQAAEFARAAAQTSPSLPLPPLTLAASLARGGRMDEARQLVAAYRQRHPAFEAAHVERFMRSSEPRYVAGRQALIDTLREIGMP